MANARHLTTALLVLATAGTVRASGACDEARGQTGLAVTPGDGGLAVAAVDAGSAAAASGLRPGDAVVQANGTVPRSCADWQRALREARKDGKALLVLARRDGGDVVTAFPAATWQLAVASVSTLPPEPPSVRHLVEKPPPAPLPAEAQVTLDGVLHALAALAPAERPPASLDGYRRDLLRVHREVETLAVRRTVSPEVVDGLRTVLRYYDAGEVAWEAEEDLRERERRPRHVPTAEGEAAPYFSDSEAAATIEQFPFLEATVAHEPTAGVGGVGESSGSWRPVAARGLLWEHAREELGRMTTWLASAKS
jgi:hypothetical protein